MDQGNIKGINIGGHHQLLHQLFANDTGIFLHIDEANFHKIMDVIAEYKRVLGVLLNLEKSTFLQLDDSSSPSWFASLGCHIAQPDEISSYLGIPVGINITPTQELEFVIDKIKKCLTHWSHQILSMANILVLLKHILRAILVYFLMIFECN